MNRLRAALALLCALAGAAHAAEITLKNAWMRPAPAGAESARAYVDITSDAPLVLTGASTPVAGKVQIVLVQTIGDPSTEAVVPTLAVPAGATTRLAYRGNHLRLSGITRDVANGDPVPLTLTFTDGAGKPVRATTNILVRGLLLPQQMPAESRDAAKPANSPAPAPAAK
ncbi:MAG: copper chaperone PCu(A)C [Casimicrobiaceae bacterium]